MVIAGSELSQAMPANRPPTLAQPAWRRALADHPTILAGGLVIGLIALLALVAPWVSPYDPVKMELGSVLRPPTVEHPLGTDDLGRDVLSRTIHGGRISLAVGVLAVAAAVALGSLLGLVSGYWGGAVDAAIMRLMDALLAIPALILAIGVTAALGAGLNNVTLAIGLVNVPAFARLVRGQVLSLREDEFVKAAELLGADAWRILIRHLLPSTLTPIVVFASLRISAAILAEASLSFLGLGAQPPAPSWGSMVNLGRRYLENAPWVVFGPGAAIFLTIISLSLLGDGVRDALDPKLRSRGRGHYPGR